MSATILIKFRGLVVHSTPRPNNKTLWAFPGKIPENSKIVFNFLTVALRSA